ncbi:MAG: aminoacyl--tRNA ligase-related protein [Candidatus Paceibacterota bacterium]
MRQSKLFTKTRKEAPADEVSKNAEFLIRGGFIHKEMAGVYDYLPLGLRVLKKIENIIREEIDAIGGQEVLMTTLQDPEIWKKSNRWDDAVVDNWFKSKFVSGGDVGIANTHEEPITNMLTHFLDSYKDLPIYIYQFQTKFRNELRAKSGIMRVKEFAMKDLYSFSKTEEEFREFYEKCAEAYTKIFKRVGIGHKTYRTLAAGGSFTVGLTDEFQTVSSAGEDIIYIDEERGLAINKEVYNDENLEKYGFNKSKLKEERAIEVGNIFPLGTKYADALGLNYQDARGEKQTITMGSYGIGLGRLLGTVVEVLSDDKGIIWPESLSPFAIHLLTLGEDEAVKEEAEKIYKSLQENNIEVLFDDREGVSPGEKFADSDLIGIPHRAVVSTRSLKEGGIEIKKRAEDKGKVVSLDELLKLAKPDSA